MKQVLQSLRDGTTTVADVPCPAASPGTLLIRSSVYADLGRHRAHAGRVRQGRLDRQGAPAAGQGAAGAATRCAPTGWSPTLEAVRSKLDQPLPLGYCNVGRGDRGRAPGVDGFRWATGWRRTASTPRCVCVPENLCARVPDACRTTRRPRSRCSARSRCRASGSRSRRWARRVVVTGLGLIGLLAVQLLRANGCRVLGIDFDPAAAGAGAAVRRRDAWTCRRGEDPVAAAHGVLARPRRGRACSSPRRPTSNEPMHQAAQMCRKRGRIVLVGVTGLELSRADFYEKELTLPGVLLVRARALRPGLRGAGAATIRWASCAGPSSATSRRCST